MPIKVSPSKLHKAIELSDSSLRNMRKFRTEALNEFLGRYYDGPKDHRARPVNLVNHFLMTVVPHLANQNPRHDVSTDVWPLRAEAKLLGLALDRLSEQLDLVGISRRNLLEALIAPCGIVKTTMRVGDERIKIRGKWVDLGQPCVHRIDFNDYICDPSARDYHELAWEGHKYLVSRDTALDFGNFDDSARALIENLPSYERGDSDSFDDIAEESGEFLDLIQLQDVYIYDEYETIMVTMPCHGYRNRFLSEGIYEGAGRSPLDRLELCPVPGRSMGLPPIAMLREQSEILNEIMNKINEQAKRTKSVLAYEAAGEDDAIQLAKAPDGTTVKVDSMGSVEPYDLGGVQAPLVSYASDLLSYYNMQSGSPDVLSGSAGKGGSDTATEYSGRLANANVRLNDYAETHARFHDRIAAKLAWYLVTDPFITMPMVHRVPGAEPIELVYDARTRQGQPDQFLYKVRRRSMQQVDPAVQSARLNEVLNTVLNAAQVTSVTGGMIDVAAVARRAGEGLGIDELDEIVRDPLLQQFSLMSAQADMQAGRVGAKGRPASAPAGGQRSNYALGSGEGARESQGQVQSAYSSAGGA